MPSDIEDLDTDPRDFEFLSTADVGARVCDAKCKWYYPVQDGARPGSASHSSSSEGSCSDAPLNVWRRCCLVSTFTFMSW